MNPIMFCRDFRSNIFDAVCNLELGREFTGLSQSRLSFFNCGHQAHQAVVYVHSYANASISFTSVRLCTAK